MPKGATRGVVSTQKTMRLELTKVSTKAVHQITNVFITKDTGKRRVAYLPARAGKHDKS